VFDAKGVGGHREAKCRRHRTGGPDSDQTPRRRRTGRRFRDNQTRRDCGTGRPGAPILIGTLRQANRLVLQHNNGVNPRELIHLMQNDGFNLT